MDICEYKIGDIVEIISHNCWFGELGIVDAIDEENKTITIFCSKFPYWKYYVGEDNINSIRKVDL